MGYKWKPSKSQKRAFAQRMENDPDYAKEYNQRKEKRAKKKRAGSKYDYETAGGEYVPTQAQHDYAMFDRSANKTDEHSIACNMVASAYVCNEKCHHDYIHIVNELMREAE